MGYWVVAMREDGGVGIGSVERFGSVGGMLAGWREEGEDWVGGRWLSWRHAGGMVVHCYCIEVQLTIALGDFLPVRQQASRSLPFHSDDTYLGNISFVG